MGLKPRSFAQAVLAHSALSALLFLQKTPSAALFLTPVSIFDSLGVLACVPAYFLPANVFSNYCTRTVFFIQDLVQMEDCLWFARLPAIPIFSALAHPATIVSMTCAVLQVRHFVWINFCFRILENIMVI